MATTTLVSLQSVRNELVNSKYYLNIRSGYMAPVTLHCSYGDSGETITFYIFDGGEELDLAGAAASIHGTRIDGANFGPFSCTVSGNTVSFTLESSMTAVEGSAIAEIAITKSSTNIGTCNFGILVEKAVFPNGVAYDTDPSVYQDILKYVQRIPASIAADITSAINGVNATIEKEITDRKTVDSTLDSEIAVERSRIDNYLKSGTAATNAELIDIRTRADGLISGSAGNAVRGQFDDANSRIYRLYKHENISINATDGYILRSTGSVTTNSGWFRTQAIDVNGCELIRITGTFQGLSADSGYTHVLFMAESDFGAEFFVSSTRVLSSGTANVSVFIQVPLGASYVYICNAITNKSSFSIYKLRRNFVEKDYATKKDCQFLSMALPRSVSLNGITMYRSEHPYENAIVFSGSLSSNNTIYLYSSSEEYLLKPGHRYKAYFNKLRGTATNDIYLQIYHSGTTSNMLVNASIVSGTIFTIPETATAVAVRFIVFAGTYTSAVYNFSIEDVGGGNDKKNYTDMSITTSAQLYEFFKSPIPFTRLILAPNDYDIYTGLAEMDIANNVVFPMSAYLQDVEIIGNHSKISLRVPTDVAQNKTSIVNTYSPLNVIGNVYVKDLTLDAYSCRYALHSESLENEYAYYSVQEFENCKFIYGRNSSVSGLNSNAVGIGGSLGQRYVFKNCYFENLNYPRTIYIHTRDKNIGELRIDNCIFKNSNTGIMLSQYTGNGKIIPVNISNSIVGKIAYVTQSGGNQNNQFAVRAINSYIPDIVKESSTTLLYTPERINTIDGTIDTTYTSE